MKNTKNVQINKDIFSNSLPEELLEIKLYNFSLGPNTKDDFEKMQQTDFSAK